MGCFHHRDVWVCLHSPEPLGATYLDPAALDPGACEPDASGNQGRGGRGVRTTADSRGSPIPSTQPGPQAVQQQFTEPVWTPTPILCERVATHRYGLCRQRHAYIRARASHPRRSVLMEGRRNMLCGRPGPPMTQATGVTRAGLRGGWGGRPVRKEAPRTRTAEV